MNPVSQFITDALQNTWIWNYDHTLIVLGVALAGDVISTAIGLRMAGLKEGNPIMRFLMGLLESVVKVRAYESAMAALVMTHVGVWLMFSHWRDSFGLLPMWINALAFAGITANNARLIVKQRGK